METKPNIRHEFVQKGKTFYAKNSVAAQAMKFIAGDRHCLNEAQFSAVSSSIQESGFEVHVTKIQE